MSFNWGSIAGLGSLALNALPAAGPYGMIASAALQGLIPSATAGGGAGSASAKTNADIGTMDTLARKGAYTSTGFFGADAEREARDKANQYIGKQSAEGMLAGNIMQNIGSSQLSAPQTILDTAAANVQRDLGNQRRQFMESMNASGAPLAARIAAASNLGQASGQNMSNLFTQGMQGTQQALATAADTFGAADRMRQQDLQTNLSLFQPSAMQLNPAMSASQLGAMGQYNQISAETAAMEDPNAPLKKLGWQGVTMGMLQPWQQNALENQRRAMQGQTPMNNADRWRSAGDNWNIFGI